MSSLLASSIPNGHIIYLPDEILLQISSYLLRFDRNAYKDLTSFAAANTRFSRVVRTTFQKLKALNVPLPKVYALFRTLRDFPASQWADRIECLEITHYVSPEALEANYGGDEDGRMQMPWKNSRERHIQRRLRAGLLTHTDAQRQSKMPSRQFNIETDFAFRMECLGVIQEADTVSNRNKRTWEVALRAGHSNAFLALLLLILPNVEKLLLGGGHIFHYPMLLRDADPWRGPMSPQANGRRHWSSDTSTQQLRNHKYLAQVFEEKYSRLTMLEMPSSWTDISLFRLASCKLQPRYYNFDDLQTLILPESALPGRTFTRSNGLVFSTLPVKLRSLTIVSCGYESWHFVRSLISYTATTPNIRLLDLRSIDLYYRHTHPGQRIHLSPVERARAEVSGIRITEYLPQHVLREVDTGGQPWKLSRNELDNVAATPLQDRTTRKIARHWVGKKNWKSQPTGAAKEHFRKRRV